MRNYSWWLDKFFPSFNFSLRAATTSSLARYTPSVGTPSIFADAPVFLAQIASDLPLLIKGGSRALEAEGTVWYSGGLAAEIFVCLSFQER